MKQASAYNLTTADVWFQRACKALGHPARLRIVKLLSATECICGSLVDQLPLSQSTVSQHLKVLRDAGLIRGEIEGPKTCYCLDPVALAKWRMMAGGLGLSGCAGCSGDEEIKQ